MGIYGVRLDTDDHEGSIESKSPKSTARTVARRRRVGAPGEKPRTARQSSVRSRVDRHERRRARCGRRTQLPWTGGARPRRDADRLRVRQHARGVRRRFGSDNPRDGTAAADRHRPTSIGRRGPEPTAGVVAAHDRRTETAASTVTRPSPESARRRVLMLVTLSASRRRGGSALENL